MGRNFCESLFFWNNFLDKTRAFFRLKSNLFSRNFKRKPQISEWIKRLEFVFYAVCNIKKENIMFQRVKVKFFFPWKILKITIREYFCEKICVFWPTRKFFFFLKYIIYNKIPITVFERHKFQKLLDLRKMRLNYTVKYFFCTLSFICGGVLFFRHPTRLVDF